METILHSEENIGNIIASFEVQVWKLSSEIQAKVQSLLEIKLPEIMKRKNAFLTLDTTTDMAWIMVDFMHDTLRLFCDIISLIDPTLKHLPAFQWMYWDIVRGFMADMQVIPVFEKYSYEEKKAFIQQAMNRLTA